MSQIVAGDRGPTTRHGFPLPSPRELRPRPEAPATFIATVFAFPNEGGFTANSTLGPRWRLRFYEVGNSKPKPVYANDSFTRM